MASNSVNVGNAGEHLVAAHLFSQEFHVFVADRNNRAFDLSVFHNGKSSLLRVKTSSNLCAQWSSKDINGTVLFRDLQVSNDYCVFVLNLNKGISEAIFYIVPTNVVHSAVSEQHTKYMSTPKKDGQPKKLSTLRAIRFFGNTGNPGFGFDVRWDKYKNNWEQLKGNELTRKSYSGTDKKFNFSHLSVDERIQLAGDLWDSLSPEDIPITEEQKQELARRLAASENGEMEYYSWEEVKANLLNELSSKK